MKKTLPQAVIWDMDGVLIDSMPLWKASISETMNQIQGSFSEQLWQRHRGKRLDELLVDWQADQAWSSDTSVEEVSEIVIDHVLQKIETEGQLKAGVFEALEHFTSLNITQALASSSKRVVIEKVSTQFKLKPFFHQLLSADQVKHGKPHPAVYMKSARDLGKKTIDCLVIEDSVTGVIAAKAARTKCLAVPEYADVDDVKKKKRQYAIADMQLSSLNQLVAKWDEIKQLF